MILSKEEMQKYRKQGRAAAKELLFDLYGVTDASHLKGRYGKYKPDLMFTYNNKQSFCDCEVRPNWCDAFPYRNFHIPGRKAKWLTYPIIFLVFNQKRDRAALIPGSVVKTSVLIPCNNLYKTGENMYIVEQQDSIVWFEKQKGKTWIKTVKAS